MQIKRIQEPFSEIGMKVGSLHTRCPAHGGSDSVACQIDPDSGHIVWKCFNCGKGGSIIDAWAAEFEIEEVEAIRDLEDRYGSGEYSAPVTPAKKRKSKSSKIQPSENPAPAPNGLRFFYNNMELKSEDATVWQAPCLVDGVHMAAAALRWDLADGSKVMRQCYYDGKKWVPKSFPYRPVPLLNEVDILRKDTVIVTEGEKCMSAVSRAMQMYEFLFKADLGVAVTTNIGGSNAVKKSNYHILNGKEVIVLRDNDEPGWKFAKHLYEKLRDVKVINLADAGSPEGYDVADWLDEGGDIIDIFEMEPETIVSDDKRNLDRLLEDSKTISALDIEDFFKELAEIKPNEIVADVILKNVAGASGANLGPLRKMWKRILKEETATDWPEVVANKIIADTFGGNIFFSNGEFWAYKETHWKRLSVEYIQKSIIAYAKRIVPSQEGDLETVMRKATNIVKAKTSQEGDFLSLSEEPPSIINVKNGQLHVDAMTGEVDLRPHNPEDKLTYCLDVDYDPEATCEEYDKAINEIMVNNKELVRHFEEVAGYMIQPRREMKNFFVFYGRKGNNGKSKVKDLICSLVGSETFIVKKIGNFGDYNHDTNMLVGKMLLIDDDLAKGTRLNDGMIKAISEAKQLTANPKGKDQYPFLSYAAVLILSNHYPVTSDIGQAMVNRINIIPFNAYFDPEAPTTDSHLFRRIIEGELSGVLNRFLEGLRRLRQRGRWQYPRESIEERSKWLRETSSIFLFLDDYVVAEDGSRLYANDLYARYKSWCHDEGIPPKWQKTRRSLRSTVEDLNFETQNGDNNKGGWYIVDHKLA